MFEKQVPSRGSFDLAQGLYNTGLVSLQGQLTKQEVTGP